MLYHVKWEADVGELERKAGPGQQVTPVRSKQPKDTRQTITAPTALEYDLLKAKLESYVQRESDLQKLKEDLDKQEVELAREKLDMDAKLSVFISGQEAYGLTRS